MSERKLLAILGRGTQQRYKGGPWEPTKDLEVCDKKFAHLPVRVPENDNHPNSIVGGGELNLLAGRVLAHLEHPHIVVCAYGNRSLYLQEHNFPSESLVMSNIFRSLFIAPPYIDVFDETVWNVKGSGTLRELHNIFTLAKRSGISNVTIVTVAVHAPRTALMVKQHLPEFPGLKILVRASEYVLLREKPEFKKRVNRILSSQSFQRNFEREINGMNDLIAGNYKPIASVTK